MHKKLMVVVALSAVIATAFAAYPAEQVQKSIPLKNGSTVYILKDGKMGIEDKVGRAVPMKQGEIMMHGNEVMRLDSTRYCTTSIRAAKLNRWLH